MSNTTEQLLNYMSKAKATAQPEAYSYEYLIPGLLGEVGEVYGQIAKNHWHGWTAEKFETELVAEYGDICWMTAILLDMRHVELKPSVYQNATKVFAPFVGMQAVSAALGTLVHYIDIEELAGERVNAFCDAHDAGENDVEFTRLADSYDIARNLADQFVLHLWSTLVVNAPVVTGHPIQKALDYNAEKLASRAARGVLRGAGDHR